jgi:hypothetical protein
MTPSQFQMVMDRFDKFEAKFEQRLRRTEIALATFTGAVIVIGFLIQQGIITIS